MQEKIRLVRNLLEKRSARRKEERFVVEGPHLVEEAQGLIDFVIYAEELPLLKDLQTRGLECLRVSKKQFAQISQVETPQSILAVVREQKFTLSDLLKGVSSLILFCIEIQDPTNLGAMIRTADALGATGVILSRGCVDLYNPKVLRGTMGSLFHLPIVQIEEVAKTISFLQEKMVGIIAADIAAKKNSYEVDYQRGVAVLVGNEAAGLSQEIINSADEAVKIPMPGKAQSLNVSISSAVLLYEVLRQRVYGREN